MKSYKVNSLFLTASLAALAVAGAAHAQAAADAGASVEAVVVTGSRLATAGFQAPTPVTVVGADQIAKRAPASVIDIVNEMPGFRNTTDPSTPTNSIRNAGQANADLRGLGVSRTLVLLNGLRHTPVTALGAVDINQIPTGLVDRVEVVTGGASAAYGSDAVAGVVNFILKNRMEGFNANLVEGISQHGDNVSHQVSLGYGHSFLDDKLHVIVGADYASNGGVGSLLNSRDWGRKEPGILTLAANRPAGLPSQIVSNYVESSATCAGGYITTTVLKGNCFAADGSMFLLPQGEIVGPNLMISSKQVNRGITAAPTQVIEGASQRNVGLGRVEYELSPTTTVFASYSYASLRNAFGGPVTSPVITINRDNPFLPAATLNQMVANNIQSFQMNIQGGYFNSIHNSIGRNPVDTWESQIGAKGKVFGDWDWQLGVVSGLTHSIRRADYYWKQGNWYSAFYAVPGPNGTIVCGPPATNPNFNQFDPVVRTYQEPGCVPWNPFGGKKTDPKAVEYSFGYSQSNEHLKQTSVDFNLAGSPFMLPAGPVSVATGAELRKTELNAIAGWGSRPFFLTVENNVSYTGDISVKEGYVEVGVPLLKDLPLVQNLDLNGAIRRTDYSSSGAVTTWKVGATWDVTEFLRFRSTRSRDIRAPNINELFSKAAQGRINMTNKVNGVTAQAYTLTSGNPNLQPEVADTLTAGVVFQPKWDLLRGFRASVDFYKIKINGVIGTVVPQDIVDRCLLQKIASYCSQVAMDPNNPLGFTSVSAQTQNLNRQYTSGVDIEADYRFPIEKFNLPGSLNVRALGSWVDDLATVANNIDLDAAGQAVPEWTWTGDLDYRLDRFAFGVQARYKSPIKYSLALVGPNDPTYNPASSNSISDNLFPGIVYISLNSSYDIVQSNGRSVRIYGIIDNAMDKDPPLIVNQITMGGNPYDLIGRSFKLGLRFNF